MGSFFLFLGSKLYLYASRKVKLICVFERIKEKFLAISLLSPKGIDPHEWQTTKNKHSRKNCTLMVGCRNDDFSCGGYARRKVDRKLHNNS